MHATRMDFIMHKLTWDRPILSDLGTAEDAKRKAFGLLNDSLLGSS